MANRSGYQVCPEFGMPRPMRALARRGLLGLLILCSLMGGVSGRKNSPKNIPQSAGPERAIGVRGCLDKIELAILMDDSKSMTQWNGKDKSILLDLIPRLEAYFPGNLRISLSLYCVSTPYIFQTPTWDRSLSDLTQLPRPSVK